MWLHLFDFGRDNEFILNLLVRIKGNKTQILFFICLGYENEVFLRIFWSGQGAFFWKKWEIEILTKIEKNGKIKKNYNLSFFKYICFLNIIINH